MEQYMLEGTAEVLRKYKDPRRSNIVNLAVTVFWDIMQLV